MATTKTPKKTYAKIGTPAGRLVWPNLNEPDEYKGKKSFTAKIKLSGADSEALIAKIDAAIEAHEPVVRAELEAAIESAKDGKSKGAAKKALADLEQASKPYKPVYDDNGDETGEFEFNFKMPDHFTGRDKKPVYIRPDIFDASNPPRLMKNPPPIWGGTLAHVSGELRPFYTALAGYGVSLRLKAVQILELATSGGGQRDASAYGFGGQEGGFSHTDDDLPQGGGTDDSDDDKGNPAGHEF